MKFIVDLNSFSDKFNILLLKCDIAKNEVHISFILLFLILSNKILNSNLFLCKNFSLLNISDIIKLLFINS